MKFQAILALSLWLLPVVADVNNGNSGNNNGNNGNGNSVTPAPVTPAPVTSAPALVPVVCGSLTSNNDCKAVAGCDWQNGNCVDVVHSTVHVPCANRTASACEDDDLCVKVKSQCLEVNSGVAVAGEACQVTLSLDTDGTPVYTEVTNKGCAQGFICAIDNSTTGAEGEIINGLCTPTSCLGKKVPGNCNGNVDPTIQKDQCNATTQRVTICHRTCSRKNPWVRITIDEDAWSGEGCGHQLQHNVEDECSNKFPWTEWGVNHRDYLIKFHGTREFVRTNYSFNQNQEKAYWRIWEPACPYVRNGQCCQWNSTTNPCCGEPPSTATPTITLKKYVGLPGSCNATGVLTLQDDTYTAKTGSNYAYCYKVSVPSNAEECLYAVSMTDPAPVGGTGSNAVSVTGPRELLCPGNATYIQGPVVGVPVGGEGPYDATVQGTGAKSGKPVTSTDAAKVTEIPTNVIPIVDIKKYAGPQGMCSASGIGSMFDDRYTVPSTGSSWQYCYVVTVPTSSSDCVTDVKIVDTAPLGGKVIAVTTGSEALCGETVKYFSGTLVSGLSAPEGPINATVSGTGVTSGSPVSDSDGAAVAPPPVIEIKKYAGPKDKCTRDDVMNNITMDDTYTPLTKASFWQYCYVISVPSDAPECLLAVTMVDTAPRGGTHGTINVTSGAQQLCPNDVKYINGPIVQGLTTTEGPIAATVTGKGVVSGVTVSDVDDATVSPPDIDIIPVVQIKKYAGPTGKCSAASIKDMFDDLYTLPTPGSSWQYCYYITTTGSTDCLIDVTMVDPAVPGGTTHPISVTNGNEQLCADQSKYIAGDIVVGLSVSTLSVAATVSGKGAISKEEVSASDAARVSPPPNPIIEIKKYAGPTGKCSGSDIMNNIVKDDTYTLTAPLSSWQYCYEIKAPDSTECLDAVKMVDTAPKGGTDGTISVTDQLCPYDVLYVEGRPVVGLNETEGPIDVVVTGKGNTTGIEVSAKDGATVKPFDGVCVRPKSACADDVELMSEANTTLPFNPITIISRNAATVTFTISNPFDDEVDAIYYQFANAESGSSKCDSLSPFSYCQEPIQVTAHCMKGLTHNLTLVDLWFVDPKVVNGTDHDEVPECCHPYKKKGTDVPSVVYSFKVYCETTCDPTTGRRALGDSSLPKPEGVLTGKHDKAELCSLEHFACGDNGKSVHVCHYSSKDGYQTYCVPQADTDVVAFFPKDYCGPCVGGYANVETSS